MADVNTQQPEAPATTTSNPIVAVGRRVKSALISHQQPSIRIQRDYADAPTSGDLSEKSIPQGESENDLTPKETNLSGRLASMFSRSKESNTQGYAANDYDSDTVDLLDVVGMYAQSAEPEYD